MTVEFALHRRFGALFSSSYARAVAMLSTGQCIAAAIPILAAPILGRLYSPADYGVLATYMAIANIFSSVSTLQLSMAILSEQSERRAVELVVLCQWVSALVALLAAVVACGIYFWMAGDTHYADTRGWMLLLPASVLMGGPTSAIQMLANRASKYDAMVRNLTYTALVSVAITLPLGMWGWGASGLFIGYFTGQVTTFVMYLALYRKLVPRRAPVSSRRLLVLMRRHRNFVMFSQPSEFIGTFNRQLPIFGLTVLGDAPLLGAFSRARQLIAMPLGLLGSSIGQVFRQRASEQLRQTGSCQTIYRKTLFWLAGVGILPTLLLMLLAPSLIRLYLGANWTEAGYVAQILAPMLYLSFVTAPLANVFYFRGYQKAELILNSAGAVALAIAVGTALQFGTGYAAIYAYVVTYSGIYISYLWWGWFIARDSAQ